MKFASLNDPKCRDGRPLLVKKDLSVGMRIDDLAPSLREIIENWDALEHTLQDRYKKLNSGELKGEPIHVEKLHSPFPRAFQWADGSAFIQHIKLVRKARGAPLPETLMTVPLMYQGGSDTFLAPTEPIPFQQDSFGLDFESEVVVVTSDVPMGVQPEKALSHIRLLMIANDVTLRGLIPDELAQGFGFFQSKPSTAFGPFAVTPDELGDAWRGGRVHLPLVSELNGKIFGNPNAGEMHFHFGDLIAHAARTRRLSAGTIIGSGTVSNQDGSRGSSCIVERRMIEKIETGDFKTPFMKPGDTIKIEMKDESGQSLFGSIFQKVKSLT